MILVDLDGVIVDLHTLALARGLLDHYPCRWDMSGCCTQLSHDDVFGADRLFDDAPPISGAVDGVRRLISAGVDIHFLSTPWPSAPESAAAKYRWVARNFGDPTMLTLTHYKALVPAALLVDDRPNLIGPWEHVTYPQPWNDDRTWPTWDDGLADRLIEATL